MSRVAALIFDFNGTLSHDEPVLCAVYQELFAEEGRPLSESAYYEQLCGLSEEAIIAGWLGVEGEPLARLIEQRIGRYIERAADGSTVLAETRAALRYAAERVPVAICSGAFRAEIEPVLDGAGISSLISFLVTADDVIAGKPAPDGYLLATERLGAPPEAIVAFEDTEAGVVSAKTAGLRCLAVRSTLPADRLCEADELVDRIDVDVVKRLLG